MNYRSHSYHIEFDDHGKPLPASLPQSDGMYLFESASGKVEVVECRVNGGPVGLSIFPVRWYELTDTFKKLLEIE